MPNPTLQLSNNYEQIILYLYKTEKLGLDVLEPAPDVVLTLGNVFNGATSAPYISVSLIAGINISIHKVVQPVGDGTVIYADNRQIPQVGRTLGISYISALAGDVVPIVTSGEINEPTWNWNPGEVYLGIDGGLTQTPPTSKILQVVGVAMTPTRLCVGVQLPIILT